MQPSHTPANISVLGAKSNERRRFVAGFGTLALGAVTPAWAATNTVVASAFSAALFKPLINQTFTVDSPKFGTVTMSLIELLPLRVKAAQPVAIEQFSLTFRGDYLAMPSAVYGVAHPATGKFALHLTALPVKRGAAPLYRADFSLLR